MTDQEVKAGFEAVYNEFWLRYRGRKLERHNEEWERMNTWASVLMKKYQFMKMTVDELVNELDQRMRSNHV